MLGRTVSDMLALRSIALPRITVGAAGTTATAAAITLAASHAGVDAVTGSISALVPTLDRRFGLSAGEVGTLLATLSASSMLAQPLGGRLADRIGAKRVAAAGAVVASALLSLLGVVGNLGLVYLLLVIGGLGSAAFHPAAAAAARRVLPARASFAISLFSAGGMVGMAAGPMAMLWLIGVGIGFTPLLMIPGIALAATLWIIVPDERRPARGTTSAAAAADKARLLRGPVGRIAAAWLLVALASTTFHAGLPLWLIERGQVDASVLGWAFGAYELAAAIGGMASAAAARRIAPARLGATTLASAPIAIALVFLTPPGSAAFYLACVAAGALLNAATPLLMVGAQDRAGAAVAAASGLMGFAAGSAGLVFVAVGALADVAGLATGLTVGFASLVPAALIVSRVLDRHPATAATADLVAAGCGCGACACP